MNTLRVRIGILLLLIMAIAACERGGESSTTRNGDPEVTPVSFSRTFVDVTEESGIGFRHFTGSYGAKLLPETLGAGAAFLDYDGDNVLDIFLVNGCCWPGHEVDGA